MDKIATTMVMVFAVATMGATVARACSCVVPPPPLEALEASDAVFVGDVVKVDRVSSPWGGTELRVHFRVHVRYKGDIAATTTLRTATDEAACGFPFEQGKRYLAYALAYEGQLRAGLCSRTANVADAGVDVEALGRGDLLDDGGAEGLVGVNAARCGAANNAAVLQSVVFVFLGLMMVRRRHASVG